jgi:glycyl-tRNA synthetase beta chain
MSNLNLLVEIGTEEIPAGYLGPALETLEERLAAALKDARLTYERVAVWGTPRRLALAVWNLAAHQPDTIKEVTGPSVHSAYDANGRPTKAAEGFARGQGVNVSDLIVLEAKKGQYLAVRREEKGQPAGKVLREMLPPLILGLPFPKSMRWGRGEITFVRPIHWLLAILGNEVLPISLGNIKADRFSRGHRFLHPGPVEISSPDQYLDRLAQAHVVASFDRRQEMVRSEIVRISAQAQTTLKVIPDDDLVAEVANLVEEPVAVLGGFEASFLELPQEILVTAMREHQRYFALTDTQGRLAPHFIAINNTLARDMAVVTRGHERVLRARLDDARFYFKEDRKTPLEAKQAELKKVVFHTLLGTSWQKVERFTRVAEYLSNRLETSVKADLLRAAALCKCDLVSGVVQEFPALQGIMGREYARLDGENEQVAVAIAEHYLPNRAGGDLPATSTGALLSLADKMDTITGCFGVGLIPTGAADPYALRRQSLAMINIILDRSYRLSLQALIDYALDGLAPWLKKTKEEARAEIIEFFRLRLKNQLTGQGVSTDGAEAVLSLHHDDLVAAVARVQALEQVKAQPDFADLAVAFKRVVNIIKKFGAQEGFDPKLASADQEKILAETASLVEQQALELVKDDDYTGLLAAIVGLKPAVDSFFDHVLVDDPDPAVKANRLALLTRVSRLFELVADFSKITT